MVQPEQFKHHEYGPQRNDPYGILINETNCRPDRRIIIRSRRNDQVVISAPECKKACGYDTSYKKHQQGDEYIVPGGRGSSLREDQSRNRQDEYDCPDPQRMDQRPTQQVQKIVKHIIVVRVF